MPFTRICSTSRIFAALLPPLGRTPLLIQFRVYALARKRRRESCSCRFSFFCVLRIHISRHSIKNLRREKVLSAVHFPSLLLLRSRRISSRQSNYFFHSLRLCSFRTGSLLVVRSPVARPFVATRDSRSLRSGRGYDGC